MKGENFMKLWSLIKDPNWQLSLGEDYNKIHFRNKHYHTVFDPVTGNAPIHYDQIDPHESIDTMLDHMWHSKKGKEVLTGIALVGIAYLLSKD